MELEKLTESKLSITDNSPKPVNDGLVGAGSSGGLLSQVVKDKKKKKKKLSARERAKVNIDTNI